MWMRKWWNSEDNTKNDKNRCDAVVNKNTELNTIQLACKKQQKFRSRNRCIMTMSNIRPKASTLRCLFKTKSISVSVGAPIRLPQNWTRVLRFSPAPKFRVEEFLQVWIYHSIATLYARWRWRWRVCESGWFASATVTRENPLMTEDNYVFCIKRLL